ncbi:MAG TPA: formylglycine-generating enzyme family protein [Phycisphaerales bacterium]|nr:formylglycine-generating enzyme family protein [Phycisphaerales bacterium]HMP36965.1 formylglycine-generating enzyme family protein [Phycisphaerales bacterium]
MRLDEEPPSTGVNRVIEASSTTVIPGLSPGFIPGFGPDRAAFIRQVLADADVVVELPGGVPLPFRRVPHRDVSLPYVFQMGSRDGFADEEPVHRVVLREAVYLAVFPVTQAQWRSVVEAWGGTTVGSEGNPEPLKEDPSRFKGDDRPAEMVSWHDAAAWCGVLESRLRLGLQSGLESDPHADPRPALKMVSSHLRVQWRDGVSRRISGFRLPSESEWECGCRAGTRTAFSSGDGESALRAAGWFDRNSGHETHAVGELRANGWGLYDVHGNVWEWCADVWDGRAYGKRAPEVVGGPGVEATDLACPGRDWTLGDAGADAQYWEEGQRPRTGPGRVTRGGSWFVTAWRCRSAIRDWWWPDNRNWDTGFRPCLVPGP